MHAKCDYSAGIAHLGRKAASPPFQPNPDVLGGCNRNRGSGHTEKDTGMYKRLILTLAVLSLVAVTPLLSACHTAAGAGEDLSATGKAIEKSAKHNTP